MKLFVLSLTLFLPFNISLAQPKYDQSLFEAFEVLKVGIIEHDASILLKYAHPEIVKLGGGADYYISDFMNEVKIYQRSGLQLKDLRVNQPSKVLIGETSLQAMLPYERIFIKQEDKVVERHYYLAISYDKGMSWFFVDMKKFGPEAIKTFVPEYNDRLSIFVNSIMH